MDGIGQSRLPMTFGLTDVATNLPQGTPGSNDTEEGVVKSLALKVLQVPLSRGPSYSIQNLILLLFI